MPTPPSQTIKRPFVHGEDGDKRRNALSIEIFFDLICPWCLIGKRTLSAAIDELTRTNAGITIELHWRPMPLLPQVPTEGLPFDAFYLQRLGSRQAVEAKRATVREAAARVGYEIAFERIARMPNTLAAHALLEDVRMKGTANQHERLMERIFSAYFREGQDIGDREVLAKLAADCGIRGERTSSVPGDERARLPAWQSASRGLGVESAPTFVFNRIRAAAGAQPPGTLLAIMRATMNVE